MTERWTIYCIPDTSLNGGTCGVINLELEIPLAFDACRGIRASSKHAVDTIINGAFRARENKHSRARGNKWISDLSQGGTFNALLTPVSVES